MRRAADLLGGRVPAPDSLGYSVKRRLLGRPLVNEQLSEQRLSNPLALGVLSPDGISSSAYGPEEILSALLPLAGLAAFALILPMTLVILFVMLLVVLSYREVVMVHIRPGAVLPAPGATALILFIGANTSFNGFPFLASYVAGDAFLPRWLLKRGHRLVFSNAIIGLTVVSIVLIIIRGANVNNLVPLYAIGVFTAFSMAGFGMARYHLRRREPGWRRRLVINFSAGVMTAIVVAIFAVVKFTEGAWIVVVLFPILVLALIRLNREYAMEAEVLNTISDRQPPPPPAYARRTVFVLVDSFDLAALAALRYARSLRPTTLRAVHFVIDGARAEMLRQQWLRADRGVVLDFIDVPDRRLVRAAAELVRDEVTNPGTHVTVILPRRSFSPLLGRFLHDRTADKIAGAVSRIPRSAATIIPFDVSSRVEVLQERQAAAAKTGLAASQAEGAHPEGQDTEPGTAEPDTGKPDTAEPDTGRSRPGKPRTPRKDKDRVPPAPGTGDYSMPVPPPGVTPIGTINKPGRATVEGRVRSVEIRPVERNSVLAYEIADSTGELTALFYGRSSIPGVVCGSRVRFRGTVGLRATRPFMVNPTYELLPSGPPEPEDRRPSGDDSATA